MKVLRPRTDILWLDKPEAAWNAAENATYYLRLAYAGRLLKVLA